jgi:hypothetical protein
LLDFILAFSCLTIGGLIGYIFAKQPPDAEDIKKYMSRIVNMEAMEEHEKLVKVRMARNSVKSTRVDSGLNARVMRMRIRKRPRN